MNNDIKIENEDLENLKIHYNYLKKDVDSLPRLIDRGYQFIYPEKAVEWEKAVYLNILRGYGSFVVEDALDVMEILNSDENMENAFDLLKKREQNHSGGSIGAVVKLIVDFAKKGPEFSEMINAGRITPEYQALLNEKKAENAKLEALSTEKNL